MNQMNNSGQPSFNPPVEQGQRMVVSKSVFCETGTHNDMTQRPYETHMSQNAVDQFRELTHNGTQYSPTLVAAAANQFIRPSAQPTANVRIDNGWDQRRFRFMFQLDWISPTSDLESRKIIQGYTGYAGANRSGAVDPGMPLYFNNVTTLRSSRIMTPHGQQQQTNVASTNQLLRGDTAPDFINSGNNISHYMRPQDLFNAAGAATLPYDLVHDTRTTALADPLTKSRRSNNNAAHYLSSAMSAYQQSKASADFTADMAHLANNARGIVHEEGMTVDKFFIMLKARSATFNEHGYVTYGELDAILENFDAVTDISFHREVERSLYQNSNNNVPWNSLERGQTEHWNGSNMETVWASIFSQSVPSLMMDLTLVRVALVATNRTIHGGMDIRVLDAMSFADNIDLTPHIEAFKSRFQNELLVGLIMNNEIDFEITLQVNNINDTRMTISIGGGPAIEYGVPSWADGLFAPVIAPNQQTLRNVADDLQMFTDEVGDQTNYPDIQTSQGSFGSNQQISGEDIRNAI